MADRTNHYELAFEAYLRENRIAYVAVDEARRSLYADDSLKSLDFLVASSRGGSWLVDVKGRQFPSGRQKRYWTNWSTQDDLSSMRGWEGIFGDGFRGLFLFAFLLTADKSPVGVEHLFAYRGHWYAFVGVPVDDYRCYARQISPRWQTLAVPTAVFRQLALPAANLF